MNFDYSVFLIGAVSFFTELNVPQVILNETVDGLLPVVNVARLHNYDDELISIQYDDYLIPCKPQTDQVNYTLTHDKKYMCYIENGQVYMGVLNDDN